MGKIRTRVLGMEEEEKKQKEEQKKKRQEKKAEKVESKKKVEAVKEEAFVKEEKKGQGERAKGKVKVRTLRVGGQARGKNYKTAMKALDKNKVYSVSEAINLLKKNTYVKFDESVEIHINVDKVGLKSEVQLPHSTGKTVRVAIVDDKVIGDIEAGKINFDILVTHPSNMPRLARLAKVLGPKGLMPNPKSGTISEHPEELVKKFTQGSLRWKTEPKFPMIHQSVGKISFEENKLEENVKAFLRSVGKSHILSAFIKTTMSPAFKLDVEQLS